MCPELKTVLGTSEKIIGTRIRVRDHQGCGLRDFEVTGLFKHGEEVAGYDAKPLSWDGENILLSARKDYPEVIIIK